MKVKRGTQLAVSIERELVFDQRLEYKTKGVALVLCALPSDQDYSLAEIAKMSKGGVQGLKTAIRQLKDHGYATYKDGVLTIKGHGGLEVAKHVEVRKAKKTLTREEHIAERVKERQRFQDEMKNTLQSMKPPMPSEKQAREFFRHWTAMDINPSIPLPYIKARRKTGNFNMLLRLRNWMKYDKQAAKNQDRL